MTTIALIKEAISALKDRTGSSTIAINKWIESEKKVRWFEACSRLDWRRCSVRTAFASFFAPFSDICEKEIIIIQPILGFSV